ncbi:hypothetical protein QBC47DRAFT_387853 [Echria macrotheca]|uniref:Uncharacterized protein n=1 Tax=Echria macrotheca TaxID=438768 RepID=A0AAJ0B7K0_9PEZI|nr:hypothetical protein QBC47DRAFT_387853 [Echria macrotheca]
MTMEELDLLILGAGWTATFLIPLLKQRGLAFAATTTDGRSVADHPTIPFRFDPSAPDQDKQRSAIAALPRARSVLITFPLTGVGPSELLVAAYAATHTRNNAQSKPKFRFIQLGSSGIWQGSQGQTADKGPWVTRHSPYDKSNPRAVAEDQLRELGGCVLNLSGLWGGARDPRHWVGSRVGRTKEEVEGKKSLHLIHGVDVARSVVAVATASEETWESKGKEQRWMLTDGFVYDWWALFVGWADLKGEDEPTEQAKWVFELMAEAKDVKALPRSMEQLGRCYDTREFWDTFGLVPLKARV